jgi:hypothetical protein
VQLFFGNGHLVGRATAFHFGQANADMTVAHTPYFQLARCNPASQNAVRRISQQNLRLGQLEQRIDSHCLLAILGLLYLGRKRLSARAHGGFYGEQHKSMYVDIKI